LLARNWSGAVSEYYMALSSVVRAPILRSKSGLDILSSDNWRSVFWAAFLTLRVAGPWLAPGYLFGTDWPGTKEIRWPADLNSSAPLQAILAVASSAVGGEITGKLLVLGSLFVAAVLAYRAVPVHGFVPGAVAATVYVLNPFVFGRLHYGQIYLLAGYAVLPWVGGRLRQLLIDPQATAAILAAVSLTLLGILTLHLFLASAVLIGAMLLAHVVSARERFAYLKELTPQLLLAAVTALGASAYWIIPLLNGRGSEGTRLAGIGNADLYAFAAIPDRQLGLLPNLLGLYGFWAEATGRFSSMKLFAPGWPVILGLLLILCGIGAIAGLRDRSQRLLPWVLGLLITAVFALILEMGVSHPVTAPLVQWLNAHISIYKGMRDAGKWGALLALVYSQMAALGAIAILDWTRKRSRPGIRSEWVANAAVGLLLVLPLYYGNGLLYGAHGEIKPSHYPAGWYAADRVLLSDTNPGRALFLPWHEYMRYSFIQNQNSIVASPAPNFFSVPVLASGNPEVPGIVPPASAEQLAVTALVQGGSKGRWAEVLGSLNVRYILLAKEFDWQSYSYLDTQMGLTRVGDYGQIVLFRVG
jgi:hypothetical protein